MRRTSAQTATTIWLLTVSFAWGQTQTLNARIQKLVPFAENERVQAAFNVHDYAQVEQILAAVPANEATRPEILAVQGALAFVAGDMHAAAGYFTAANDLKSLSNADSFTWSMALVKLGDNAGSRRVLSRLHTAEPGNALYIYWLGKIDYGERRYADAIAKLQQALQLDANSTRTWDSLGLAYDMQGEMDQAREAFEKAVTLNRASQHPSPWPPHNLGYLLLRAGRPLEAEASLRESLKYDPTFVDAHYHLGRTLEKLQRNAEAVVQYKFAVDGDPAATDACYSLAMLYRKLNREQDSVAMFAEYKRRKKTNDSPPVPDPEK
ncbi:MAG TPA: tetratricopeptide repeat protein [Bryobacteraceae bacterium]|jgi:tetratricopeptide (TPR) repeat protein|nr:tetratricopeptide repeat protein [Bryobacteraceae bacterium]